MIEIRDILSVFILSMVPVAELRVAIPMALGLGMNSIEAFIISVIGNMLPIPFLILFARPVISYLEKLRPFRKIMQWVDQKIRKRARNMQTLTFWGLCLFVAIPLPGTGAWTGAGIAAILEMRLKHALPAIFLGVLGAGIVVTLASLGVIHISHVFYGG